LLALRHFPEVGVGKYARGDDAKHLGHQVVVGEEFVDAPEHESFGIAIAALPPVGGAEGGGIEMGVEIPNRLGEDGLGDLLAELGVVAGGHESVSFNRSISGWRYARTFGAATPSG